MHSLYVGKMLLISDSLHNSLVILSVLFISFLFFLTLKELRELWQHVHIIYNKSSSSGSSHVLLLQSSQLSDLSDTLSSVDDTIEIHPRQIRRILRRALDSNIVKDVATSKPDSYLKQPTFNKINHEYILRVNHHRTAAEFEPEHSKEMKEETTICFDFYFGVPKSYYFQIQSITNLSNKRNMMCHQESTQNNAISKQTEKQTNSHNTSDRNESPLKSLMALATNKPELTMERINSKSSFKSKSSIIETQMETEPANEGIEMMQITAEIQNIKHKSNVITLQKLIPNEYVYREFVESKCGEDISFEESDLENTIATIIGNIKKRELIKKRGTMTKYKKYSDSKADTSAKSDAYDEMVNEDGFYFCVLLSYIRYTTHDKGIKSKKRKLRTSNIVSNLFKKKKDAQPKPDEDEEKYKDDEMESNNDDDAENDEAICEFISENGMNYAVKTLEISIFDPPSAFLPRNQHKQGKSKKSKKKSGDAIKTNDENIMIENALEPRLCFKLLCDFGLQRLVEYYDIFGISSDAVTNNNANLDCKICFSFPANIILLPCRHCCCCLSCYKHIEQCPMCRKPIRQTLRWKSD